MQFWGRSSSGRAFGSQSKGGRFESDRLHKSLANMQGFFIFHYPANASTGSSLLALTAGESPKKIPTKTLNTKAVTQAENLIA